MILEPKFKPEKTICTFSNYLGQKTGSDIQNQNIDVVAREI